MAKVFGIGFSRTGTTSLTAALVTLGFKTIHYPQDAITARELRHRPDPDEPMQLTVLRSHDAVTDTPAALCYRQLDLGYPGSRFILTLRDEEDWLGSVQRHFSKNPRPSRHITWLREQVYGTAQFDAQRLHAAYRAHVTGVQRYFADRAADLLQLNICAGSGWAKLCPFLNRPIPAESFPCLNASR